MKTAVMTDTNSGITKKEARELGLYLMPMPVIINGSVYYEDESIDEAGFYAAQSSGAEVSTSQPSPGEVLGMWDLALKDGWEEIVYIPMTSGLSKSCEMAIGLAASYGGKVQVADNHRISVPLRESVLRAVSLAKEGHSAAGIKEQLEREAYLASIYITVDTLEYLKKGGRISPAAAMLGTVMQIKPVLSIRGGVLEAFAKSRGRKNSLELMVRALKKDAETRFSSLDPEYMRVCAAGTALSQEEIDMLKAALLEEFPGHEVLYNPLPISVGCHTGPGAMGVGICF
ncbi:MAG: DegV family protein [Acutalibacter sp.]|jgi:DegV family protein with EDD domain|uniref:DegV family protein n=1 Tax=Acutalibacter sp. TaxID=1918636 RepID=UPI00216C8DB7|nr:DegV family protein [Acutalibacter sp.]MCI9225945.1 DegV family protein [Acutalibacter sp.]